MTDTPETPAVLGRPGQAYEAARLRVATFADAERIAELWRLAYPEEDVATDTVREWLGRGGALVMHDRAGGLLAALPWREAVGGWRVERVATLPAERGQGYGRWLMTKVEALAIRANVPYLWLHLPGGPDDAEQIPYYARMGYVLHDGADGDGVTLRKRVGGVWQTKSVEPPPGPARSVP
jgi:GNAT superfamily N-acetyltransferase